MEISSDQIKTTNMTETYDIQDTIRYTREELDLLIPMTSCVLAQRRLDTLKDVLSMRTFVTYAYYEGMPEETELLYERIWQLLYRLTNLYQQEMAHM
jgi:hypothetical protein